MFRTGLNIALCAAVSALALSGCLGADEPSTGPALSVDPDTLRFPTTYYFADEWGLSEAQPVGDTKHAALGDFYTKWAVGKGFPEWVSKPVGDPMVVTGQAELEFWVTAESVVTSTPGIFPDFVVYFGTSESVLSVVSPTKLQPVAEDFSVIQSGDAVPVRATFDLPPGGVTVPAHAGIRVVTAPVMMESEPADLLVLYGSAQYPSQVRFNVSYPDAAPWAALEPVSDTTSHTLLAGTFLHQKEVDDVNVKTISVDVTNHTQALLVDLVYTGKTPFPDMDLYAYSPNGTLFALSVTPGSDESIHLYGPNLEAGGVGEWTFKVVNYVTVGATFDLTVTTHG